MFPSMSPLMISVEKQGPEKLLKPSFPMKPGRYSEIRTDRFEFCFNLNGEIRTIRGLTPDWPHPAEQFKRTAGNDWVYYTVGDKSGSDGLISWMGEYYLPCLPYPSNPVWDIPYTGNPKVMAALAHYSQLFADLYMARAQGRYPHAAPLLGRILASDDQTLYRRAQDLNRIIGTRVSVLPPDTRHVDYDVIPLTLADGCLYQCKFCCVKTGQAFRKRTREDILAQVAALKAHFGPDLDNYHGLFLGNHDALAAGADLICFGARAAHEAFGFRPRAGQRPFLFLFGSIGALLKSGPELFEKLNQLPFYTYINLGFESLDPATLADIGKPVTPDQVRVAFDRMLAVNAAYDHLEITGNFIAGDPVRPAHYATLTKRLSQVPASGKGTVYLSPLRNSPKKRELLPLFHDIKAQSRLPVYIYLIQRL